VSQLLELVRDMLMKLVAPVGLKQARKLGIQERHRHPDVSRLWRLLAACRHGPGQSAQKIEHGIQGCWPLCRSVRSGR